MSDENLQMELMYRAVFIDWDDTIGDWGQVARKSQRELYNKYHLAEWFETPEEWFEKYNTHNTELWVRYGKNEITKDYLYLDHFLFPLCQQIGITTDMAPQRLREMAKKMADEYVYLTNTYCRLMTDAEEVVRYLANKYPLTVVSNGFVECQYHKMEHTGLLPYFKHIVLSEEVNIQKPNPQIFEKAMTMNRTEMPDLQKDEVVMIGDSYTSDIAGAKAAGIDSIWVLAGEATDEQRKDATYIVPHLRDVMTIL